MYFDHMPLFPPMKSSCDTNACVKMQVFGPDHCCKPCPPPCLPGCPQKVLIENPCKPGECAEVILGLDECGSLTICVHRMNQWDCRPDCRPPKPRHPRKTGCNFY